MRKNRDDKVINGAFREWLLGHLPAVAISELEESQKKVKNANRYLKFQSIRIDKMIKEKKYGAAALI